MNLAFLRHTTLSLLLLGGTVAMLPNLLAEGGSCSQGQSSCGSCAGVGKAKPSSSPVTGTTTNAPAKR